MIELTLGDAEYIAYEVAQEMMTTTEPMPAFADRLPHKLESVLAAPFISFDGKEVYETIAEKAAVLFYSCCKSHPFQNGNKRMAVVMTMVFLAINGWWVREDPMVLYKIAIRVAKSKPVDRDAVLQVLTEGIQNRLMTVEEVERLSAND